MHKATAQPKAEIGVRVYRVKEDRWTDHEVIKLPGKMAQLLRKIMKPNEGEDK